MARSQNDQKLDRICNYIKQNPDLKPGSIASQLGYHRETVQQALAQLEKRGDLLMADDKDRVRWFKKREE